MQKLIVIATMLVAMSGASETIIGQQTQSVSFSYQVPSTATRKEPIVADVVFRNRVNVPVEIDLGRNGVGNLELRLRTPNGDLLVSNTKQPKSAEEAYTNIVVTLQPNTLHVERVILNEWFSDLDTEGEYQLTVSFIGTARNSQGSAVALAEGEPRSFLILPRNPSVLRATCERLATTARSTSVAVEARQAAKILGYVQDPIAIESLASLIEQGKTLEIAAVEFAAIKALERMGTLEAQNALLRARLNARKVTADQVDHAIVRMSRGVK